eukprot:TRINITY_DN16796_c0_g1_i28.p1 TRINITY_DN16796_c0_g1~~TRINITY_DN16796_c0_g1_i28.p1  ORF type:complete len:493 (-),score=155.77 TRINITY_DN16796_c0_g1_i28:27-1505(-)
MIPAIKEYMKKKQEQPRAQLTPPQREAGLGASPVTAALAAADLLPDDTEKLKEYLTGPDCDLFSDAKDDAKDMKTPDLFDALEEGKGLDNTIDLCQYLDEDGKKFATLPDLVKHLKDALPKKRKVKDRMKKLVGDPARGLLPDPSDTGDAPVNDKDVEDLYDETKAGPQTAALVRELVDDGRKFSSIPELGEALKDAARARKKRQKDDKAALRDYLEDPTCPAFTPEANKDKKEIDPHAINDLYKQEKSGPGTVALLNALEEAPRKAKSVPDLLAAAKDLSAKKRKELQDHLADPKCPAYSDNKAHDVKKDTSPDMTSILAAESEAGPATLADLKAVEAAGKKVQDTEDLIPLIKAQHKKKKDVPKSSLTAEEKKSGDGVGAASKGFDDAMAKQDPDGERAALADYLKNPDVGLLDEPARDLSPKDLDAILAEGDGTAKDAIDKCEYLDHDGRRFPAADDLADHLRDALPKREIGRAVQQECRDRSRMPSSA